jgi:hypothetical protein
MKHSVSVANHECRTSALYACLGLGVGGNLPGATGGSKAKGTSQEQSGVESKATTNNIRGDTPERDQI